MRLPYGVAEAMRYADANWTEFREWGVGDERAVRVLAFVWRLHDNLPGRVHVVVPVERLAAWLGCCRQTVGKALRMLAEAGLIEWKDGGAYSHTKKLAREARWVGLGEAEQWPSVRVTWAMRMEWARRAAEFNRQLEEYHHAKGPVEASEREVDLRNFGLPEATEGAGGGWGVLPAMPRRDGDEGERNHGPEVPQLRGLSSVHGDAADRVEGGRTGQAKGQASEGPQAADAEVLRCASWERPASRP